MTNDSEVFNYPYFKETVEIYNYLKDDYSTFNVYFSKHINKPSVCLETKEKKLEFYVAENTMQNNEVWLFNNWDELPHKTSGGGYGEKLKNIKEQVKTFIESCEIKKPQKQMSLFDF